MSRALVPAAVALAISALAAGCASPYRQALESRDLMRPEPPMTAADQRAIAPYQNSPYFSERLAAFQR
ncbi:MAG TPA: hypothetical protein VK196_06215 [Magnetospirillum sp.]|nr:hypothetical protein [Magnetospirillum sp.]